MNDYRRGRRLELKVPLDMLYDDNERHHRDGRSNSPENGTEKLERFSIGYHLVPP